MQGRTERLMETASHPSRWKVLLAFSMIYFVWGSTFLAIRVGVREVPPFLLAGMRFVVAGLAMYLWMRARGTSSPSAQEWRGASLLAVLFFVFDYGLVFWAETRVPSGMTAVMMALIPVFMALSEIVFMKTQQITLRLVMALLMGVAGVGVLVSRSTTFGDGGIDRAGAAALLVATVSWSVASALARKVPLPASKAMSSGVQMLAGGVLLTIAAALLGEFRGFHLQAVSFKAWLALAYLIVAGSIVAFTAYVWLIHHESPTKVGTYAYVNPVVAVLLGYFFAGEVLGPRTIVGTSLVLASVTVITTGKKRMQAASESLDTKAAPQLRTEELSQDEAGG